MKLNLIGAKEKKMKSPPIPAKTRHGFEMSAFSSPCSWPLVTLLDNRFKGAFLFLKLSPFALGPMFILCRCWRANLFPAGRRRGQRRRGSPRKSIVVFPENNRRGGGGIKPRVNTAAFVFFTCFEGALEAGRIVQLWQTLKQPALFEG